MTSKWLPTSDGEGLIASLRRQPLLLVFRPEAPLQLAPLLERLQALGFLHVEIACRPCPDWGRQCRELIHSFPALRLGAASMVSREALQVVVDAGFAYGVSPILDQPLQDEAAAAGFLLVPGVMTPTEVRLASTRGSGLVKLFPAATLGPTYWSSLRDPLGGALPFCIAAGGIALSDVSHWLASGVDAVAVGSRWLGDGALLSKRSSIDLEPLRTLLAEFALRQ
ncbi:MAG: bifunctional 4-hydroxy-2-oxoglutarate aldolase/2-dehydro-3-deoxy-phosphogluconate aldolase [Cyanobacteriota bacterium]|nr:bifunctional 4-hydroxy-2-oxoglutarate aldolase/2-dehydro-3-deoxy-phosphogluconate aldolase [Cyanobacteriota bacterium]